MAFSVRYFGSYISIMSVIVGDLDNQWHYFYDTLAPLNLF